MIFPPYWITELGLRMFWPLTRQLSGGEAKTAHDMQCPRIHRQCCSIFVSPININIIVNNISNISIIVIVIIIGNNSNKIIIVINNIVLVIINNHINISRCLHFFQVQPAVDCVPGKSWHAPGIFDGMEPWRTSRKPQKSKQRMGKFWNPRFVFSCFFPFFFQDILGWLTLRVSWCFLGIQCTQVSIAFEGTYTSSGFEV